MLNSKQQQELEENLVFLQEQFRDLDSQIKLPHSLDAEILRYKLEHLDLQEDKPKKKLIWLRPLAGAAACFVLVFGSIYAMRGGNPASSAAPNELTAPMSSAAAAPSETAAEEAVLNEAAVSDVLEDAPVYASNYAEVRDAAVKMNAEFLEGGSGELSADDISMDAPFSAAVPETVDAGNEQEAKAIPAPDVLTSPAPKAMAYSAPAGNFSAANPEEYGANSQDTLKSEDGYVYSYVRGGDGASSGTIYVASAENAKVASKIVLQPDLDLREFYIHEDRLITVGARYGIMGGASIETLTQAADGASADSADSGKRMQETPLTTASVYDISDPANPKEVQTYTQDGGYLASRMSDSGKLSMVSNKYVDASALTDQNALLSELVPVVSNNGEVNLLAPEQLAISKLKTSSASFSVTTVMDPDSGSASTQAILGGTTDGAYLTDASIYLYGGGYQAETQAEFTRIVRFASAEGLRFAGETSLAGRAGGYSAFNEAGGNLRVVLTAAASIEFNVNSINSISVLGADLSLVGSLQGVSGSDLSSVRYLDDAVYLGLSQESGVLAVDLRDPSTPKLAGEQAISALPDYLRSVGGGLLVGIGGTGDGMKLSLLDASDPLKLKELHSITFSGGSEALYNDRSVLVDTTQKLVAFQADGTPEGGGYRVYSYDRQEGFALQANLKPLENFCSRGVTVGNELLLCNDRQIAIYQLKDFSKPETITL